MTTYWKAGIAIAGGLFLLFALAAPALSQSAETTAAEDASADDGEDAAPEPLTEDELEVLVARIALYPDDLVSLVIASSLYPLQIVQAARYLDQVKEKPELKPSEKWDGSVISLLNYPDVVKMMNDDLDWTEQLGEAAVNQQKDLLVAIQQLRDQAVAKDVLKSTDKVVVEKVNDNVVVKSADPEVVYVPTYPPEMLYDPAYVAPPQPIVYSDPYPSYYYPAASYWAGAVTGAVWASVVDWDDWGVWGGDVDIDVDVDKIKNKVDFDFNKIDIDKIDVNKLKKVDWKNVDRSKIKNVNFDKKDLKRNLERNSANKITNKVKDRPKASNVRKPSGKDVRKNVQANLKSPGRPNPPKGKPAANISKPAAKPAVARKPSSAAVAKKQVAKPKPAARVDNRPKKPSVMGNPGKGKVTKVQSNRGSVSRGGGFKGGALKGGGGHRSFGGGGRRR